MQQVDDPPSLPVGTEVSAKYKGAFCEAKVSKVVRNIKVKVAYKHNLGSGIVSDDAIKSGLLRVGSVVEVKHPDRKDTVEATVTKIQDCSQYTVVFDDGDITTLRRTALCLKSGRHFNESETLDQLPLTHPEHFGNPVVGGRRGRRRHINEDSSEEEDESDTKEVVNEKEEHIGKVVCVETESKKKDKEKWFPGLVVSPNAQATVRIRVKDEYLVRSFKDGRYYTVPKKEATEFTREAAAKQDGPAVQAALEFLDSDVLPPHWDRDALFGLSNSSSEDDGEMDSDSSDDEPREEKDRFVAQLYKYMDDRGTPLNKVPSIQSRDVDLYRLFRAVQKRGGYNRVTAQNQWKSIAIRLGFTPVTISVTNLVKQAYKKFLQPYGEFHRKLGCSMLMTPRNSNRSKGRSLVRANSVASPKPAENVSKDINSAATANVTPKVAASTQPSTSTGIIAATVAPSSVLTIQSATEESENTSESSVEISKNKRKTSVGSNKVKGLVEKYEEKSSIKDEGDVPLSKIKAAAASSRVEEKETTVIVKDVTSTMQVTTSRDGSPTGLPGSSKKEKYQKKPTPQSDEKRGKRKKDEVSVEKVDVGDFIVEIGDKLKVYYHEKKVTYEAKVIEITLQRGTPMYLVHYTGWNNRYDEWVPRERIAENLTKGSKQKGRTSSTSQNEKSKENPPKPPTAAQLSTPTSGNLSSCIISSSNSSSKTPTSARRGRGRSDSLPPRSTTPSSVASNSSRTKSPAASTLKRRPARTIPTNNRRTSANASDVSMPSESDTDSDEPVRRPTRGTKDTPYKSGSSVGKSSAKNKLNASAGNSQTDTDEDDEDDDGPPRNRLGSSAKGRDYDLNQIRSELKGFQDIKSPSPVDIDDNQVDTKDASTVKSESNVDTRPSTSGISIKAETKQEPKEEPTKLSTTDISSETDSFADDDSQSSDKTTTLENMTKKFQQKITADKQRALEKQLPSGKIVAEKVPLSTKTHIVEKIIKDSLAEKRQESLKAKPIIKEETKLIKIERDISNTPVKGGTPDAIRTSALIMKDEDKNSITPVIETKPGIIAPARFGTGSVGKYTSVIVEKPLSVVKKTEPMNVKKFENPKKQSSEATSHQMKKASEATLHKDIIKIEPPAACSPSSSSSSCSSSSSSSTSSVSSRSLPDMSKLDISGSSSTSSTTTNKDGKLPTAVIPKPISPDIYEFKDPEPFEYEMRKSTLNPGTSMSSVISNMSITTTASGSIHQTTQFENKRKPVTKISTNIHQQGPNSNSESSVHIQSPISAFVNRKKRGSPMKESASEKSKQFKIDEKQTSPIVLEAKLSLRSSAPTVLQATASTSKTSPTQNKSTHAPVTSNTPITNLSNKSIVVPANLLTPQKNEHFDALRKSPSFNLNINALNEELAQTVQETTRALTDVLQTPPPPPVSEITPTKSEPSSSSSTVVKSTFSTALPASPKLTTPPNAPPPKPTVHTAGSPFIETRKDLSNVFELSSNENEGTGSTGGHKDNKFELENVKILLSASASGFDVDPVKFENKPTSIADKVLKAISQKKEEVENKNKEMKNDLEKDVGSHPAVEPEAPTNEPITVSSRILQNTQAPTTSVITEPLKIVTDLPNTSSVLCKKDPSIEKITGGLSSQLSMRPLLASPDSKLGILESITVKNNDLSETIQKLECAIQKKTPVSSGTSLAAASPSSTIASAPPTTFSDDSMDSTDSERRLVIEDEDEPNETQKSPHAPLPHSDFKIQTISTVPNTPIKIDPLVPKVIPVGSVVTSSASITIVPSGSTSTIPLKIATPGKANTVVVTSSASITSNLVGKLHANTSVILTTKPGPMPHPPATKPQQHPISTPQQSVSGHAAQSVLAPIEVKKEEHIGHLIGQGTPLKIVPKIQNQPQRTSTVVPIVLPDIPVSVVVASSAVPSVVAAAQAAAAAAQQTPSQSKQLSIGKTALSTTSTQMITSQATTSSFSANSASLKTFENAAAIRTIPVKPSSGIISSSQTNINEGGVFTPPTSSSSSVFFIDRTELRPDDGVKPIEDYSHSSDENPKHDKIRGDPKSDDTSAGNAGGSIDANNDSINLLLCEETIPGSPAPAFGKEESVHRNSTHSSDDKGTDYEQGGKDIPTSTGLKSGATEVNPTPNSSPNDSASQDESSEDIKKNVDLEHEISPRKRRRTRKQSEMMAIINEHQTKRRRPLVYAKKNTAGSDSDDNSDTISQRSTTSARHQQQMQQTSSNGRQCPYNFLIQLDPSLNPDQRIAVLLKQIQDLRKTYSMIKGDLASIDRRRKKLRRREREKKQQNQQQIKIA